MIRCSGRRRVTYAQWYEGRGARGEDADPVLYGRYLERVRRAPIVPSALRGGPITDDDPLLN